MRCHGPLARSSRLPPLSKRPDIHHRCPGYFAPIYPTHLTNPTAPSIGKASTASGWRRVLRDEQAVTRFGPWRWDCLDFRLCVLLIIGMSNAEGFSI